MPASGRMKRLARRHASRIMLAMSKTKTQGLARARRRVEGWEAMAEFYGRSVRAMFDLRDRDPAFRSILRRSGRFVFAFEDDLERHRDRVFTRPY